MHSKNSPSETPPYTYQVKTFCPAYHITVTLTLQSPNMQKGLIVKGKPIQCNYQETCLKKHSPFCYLKCIQIETRRNLK
ncbi:MAG: hypothetical protein QXH20_00445 [Candidatus Bathyarchaeia archaeon]